MRYLRLSSTREAYEAQLELFRQRLGLRGYRSDAVDAQLAKHPYESREKLLASFEARYGARDGHDRVVAADASVAARALADGDDVADAPLADDGESDEDEVDLNDEPQHGRASSTMHVVMRRHPAAERVAPQIRSIVRETLAIIAPSDHSAESSSRVTIAWKLPEPLERLLAKAPRADD